MPLVSLHESPPFVDGRQSDRALIIRSGLERHFEALGRFVLPELTLASGQRADLAVLCSKGSITIVEIKSSIEDFKGDTKWPNYRDYCDCLYFATLGDVPSDIFPTEAGLFVCDEWGAECLRTAPDQPLAAARRKAMLIRFATAASSRLARSARQAGGYRNAPLSME